MHEIRVYINFSDECYGCCCLFPFYVLSLFLFPLLVACFPKIFLSAAANVSVCGRERERESEWNGGWMVKGLKERVVYVRVMCTCSLSAFVQKTSNRAKRERESINFPTLMLLPNRHYCYYYFCCCFYLFLSTLTYISAFLFRPPVCVYMRTDCTAQNRFWLCECVCL